MEEDVPMPTLKFGIPVLALAAFAATALTPVSASAAGKLTVYCGVQEEWCQAMVTAFTKKTGVDVSMTRKSAGEVYAQVKAEAANPKGDIWWGGTGDPHLQAAEEKLTMAYSSPLLKDMAPWALSQAKESGNRTVGIYAGALGFGYNTEQMAKKGVKAPACWKDLLDPAYKGEVQMANPNSSGTAYNMLATMVQIMGEDQAFDYLRKLNANVNQYTKSGAAPVIAAGRGETLIGIAFMHDGVTQTVRGFPVKVVAPCEGTGYEIGSQSIIEGARNLENAKLWYDWALTPEAQNIGATVESFQVPSNKNATTPKESPNLGEIKLIDYNFKLYGSAAERQRLLSKWDKEIKAVSN